MSIQEILGSDFGKDAFKTKVNGNFTEIVNQLADKLPNSHDTDETAHAYIRQSINNLDANKVDNSRVLTDVPVNAKFTDTVTTINGKTGAITKADIVALGIPAQDTNTTYSAATTSAAGLMSAADKTKLDGIATGANNYVHPTTHPASMITESSTKRFVSDSEKSTWNSKSDTDTVTTINGKTGAISKADIVALGIPSQDTTYSEISTSEIDAGTSSTLRTITGRRVKYLLDKVQGWINALTKSDIGLGDVENYSIATQSEAESGTANNRYMTPLGTKQAINTHNIYESSHQDIRQQINDLDADKVDKVWGTTIQATLINGWTGTLEYSKNDLGEVWLRGTINAPTTVAWNQGICYLPALFRPTNTINIPIIIRVTGTSGISIDSDGTMRFRQPASDLLDISKPEDERRIHINYIYKV